MTPADPTRREFLAACAGTLAAPALPTIPVPASAPPPASLRISGLPPGVVVSLWLGAVGRHFARADEAGTARFDPARVPPGRYAVRWGFPETWGGGMIEVRIDPNPGVAVVADYLYPHAAREETP